MNWKKNKHVSIAQRETMYDDTCFDEDMKYVYINM